MILDRFLSVKNSSNDKRGSLYGRRNSPFKALAFYFSISGLWLISMSSGWESCGRRSMWSDGPNDISLWRGQQAFGYGLPGLSPYSGSCLITTKFLAFGIKQYTVWQYRDYMITIIGLMWSRILSDAYDVTGQSTSSQCEKKSWWLVLWNMVNAQTKTPRQ